MDPNDFLFVTVTEMGPKFCRTAIKQEAIIAVEQIMPNVFKIILTGGKEFNCDRENCQQLLDAILFEQQ